MKVLLIFDDFETKLYIQMQYLSLIWFEKVMKYSYSEVLKKLFRDMWLGY